MVATQTQLRRGTSAQCEGGTPAEGEPWVDLTNDTLRIGDGLRAGGFIMPNFNHIQSQSFQFAVAGGTANALTLTLSPAPLSYSQPLKIVFRASNTNTGATTIDVNGLGVRDIQKISNGTLSNLSAGDLVSGGLYEAAYDGTKFQLQTLTNAGIVSVSQGDLNTSTGGVSSSSPEPLLLTLPGGEYGFYPQIRNARVQVNSEAYIGAGDFGTSYRTRIALSTSLPSHPTFARQRYITSSPPYDLGDGDVGGFIFVLLNQSGDIESTYIADTPPWAYNGPTDIRCTHKCPVTNKKYRKVMKKLTPQQIMDGARIEYKMEEITHDIKNADMGIIPHPFGNVPDGSRVVLLDPMSDKVSRMIEMQNAGNEEIADMISSQYISIDNSKIKRSCPNSVIPCKFTFKGKK